MDLTLTASAAALARYVRGGGDFSDREIREALNLHRNTLIRSWESLVELGALSVTPAPRGRPRTGEPYVRTVIVHEQHWLWTLLDALAEDGAR